MTKPSPDEIDRARESIHELGLTNFALWEQSGLTLLRAARLLVVRTLAPEAGQPRDVQVLGAGLMLRGFAIENLLKGRHLQRGGKLKTKPAGNIPGCDSHDLSAMAEVVALEVDEDERRILQSLQTCVGHAGRYPIGRFADQSIVHVGEHRDDRSAWSMEHERVFEVLLWRLIHPFFPPLDCHPESNSKSPPSWGDLLKEWMRDWVCTTIIEFDHPTNPEATAKFSQVPLPEDLNLPRHDSPNSS